MRIYWLTLLKNLKNYMEAVRDPDAPERKTFEGVDIHIGKGSDVKYPYIDLIWAGETGIPKIMQGKRSIEIWIDCWSKYVQSDTEEFCEELYAMQCAVADVLDTWTEYLQTYTFPGGKHFGATMEIKKLCSDGIIAPPTTASRFIVELSVKEVIHSRIPVFSTTKI